MTHVNGIQPTAAPKAIEQVQSANATNPVAQPTSIADVVEISPAAILAAKVHQLPEVRVDLVKRVKAEIAQGTYETSERIEVATDRIMADLPGTE